MNSAAAIIDALNARHPESRMREAARASWGAWIERFAQRPGRVSGAPVEDVVSTLAAREPAPPPARDVELNRWQAFATLWRQHWHPASDDERRWRWTAGSVSFVWNLVIAILLLVVTALHVVPPRPPEEEQAVQVEYIGRGTPVEEGGGPAPAPAASAQAESPAASKPAGAAASTPATSAPSSSASTSTQASARTEVSPAPQAPQPVVLTTPVSPEPPTFTLPPTTLPTPTIEPIRAATPDVRLVPIPSLAQAPSVNVPVQPVEVQPRPAATPEVAVREVPVAPRAVPAAPSLTTPVQVDRAAASSAEVRARDIPLTARAPSSAPGAATTAAASPATTGAGRPASSAPGSAATPSSSAGTGPASSTTAGVGMGPKSSPAPGSWATPRRGDDWGESTRNRPGNSLFDGDGQPRLANGPGSASAGHPPGMITQEIKDLDRAGTWLKRKPYAYEPTRWDRFWQPNDNLLQEWVRKGVKEVGIPIPGTKKRIKCVISILQLGGGCFDIEDPNMQDRPASARPPPPVPFKPQLQEGNGATWDKDGKAPPPPKLPGLFAPPKSGVPPESSATGDDGSN